MLVQDWGGFVLASVILLGIGYGLWGVAFDLCRPQELDSDFPITSDKSTPITTLNTPITAPDLTQDLLSKADHENEGNFAIQASSLPDNLTIESSLSSEGTTSPDLDFNAELLGPPLPTSFQTQPNPFSSQTTVESPDLLDQGLLNEGLPDKMGPPLPDHFQQKLTSPLNQPLNQPPKPILVPLPEQLGPPIPDDFTSRVQTIFSKRTPSTVQEKLMDTIKTRLKNELEQEKIIGNNKETIQLNLPDWIQAIQAHFDRHLLTIELNDRWYTLPPNQQDWLANHLLMVAEELDFDRLELLDSRHKTLARRSVLEATMVILHR
jgi:hypothetical protein